MCNYHEVMNHGEIEEIFSDVFFVTGTMKNEFFGSMWQFSRNMFVVRDGDNLTLVNTVRLSDDGLKQLESLGTVTNVVRIGDMHGVDDPFYVDRYKATFWAMPGMTAQEGLNIDKILGVDGEMPFENASLFTFETVKRPEGIIKIHREGGIMLACDSLQNWKKPNEFFDDETVATMSGMNFFQEANLGPAWMHESQPQASDFERLKKIPFEHALCGHGEPFINGAQAAYHARFNDMFQNS